MPITPARLMKRVVIEYLGIEEQVRLSYQPPTYIDDHGRSEQTGTSGYPLQQCFMFSMPEDNNTMVITIDDIAEVRLTPPTEAENLWRVGFSYIGHDDEDRVNEYVTSKESAMRLIADWTLHR